MKRYAFLSVLLLVMAIASCSTSTFSDVVARRAAERAALRVEEARVLAAKHAALERKRVARGLAAKQARVEAERATAIEAAAREAAKRNQICEAQEFEGAAATRKNPLTGAEEPFADAKAGVEDASHWAFDARHQALAAVFPKHNLLKLFGRVLKDGSGEITNQVATGKKPSTVFCKQTATHSLLFVACDDDKTIEIYEARTLKRLKSIKLEEKAPSVFASASSEADPLVYFLRPQGRYAEGFPFGCIDGETLEVYFPEVPLKVAREVVGFRVTPDGQSAIIAMKDTFRIGGPFLVSIKRSASGVPTLSDPVKFTDRDAGGSFCDKTPSIVFGKKIFTLDNLEEAIAEAPKDFTGWLLQDRAIWLDSNGRNLEFNSLNDGRNLAQVKLADPKKYFSSNHDARSAMFHDPQSQRLIRTYGHIVHVVELAPLELPMEPFLMIQLKGDLAVSFGQEAQWSVRTTDASGVLSLGHAPSGMTIKNGVIKWRPSAADIGKLTFEVIARQGDIEVKREIEIAVQRDAISFDFTVINSAQSPNGRYLLIVGFRRKEKTFHLCLVDFEEGVEVARRDLAARPYKIALGDDFAAYFLLEEKALHVLSRSNLSEHHVLNFEQGPRAMSFVSPSLFVIDMQTPVAYSLPSWEKLSAPPPASGVAAPAQAGSYLNGFLKDNASGKILSVLDPQISGNRTYSRFLSRTRREDNGLLTCLSQWGVMVRGDDLVNNLGMIRSLRSRAAQVLNQRPMVALVQERESRIDFKSTYTLSLDFHRLIDGEQVASIAVDYRPATEWASDYRDSYQSIFEYGKVLALLRHGRAYIIDLPNLPAESTPTPLGFTFNEGLIKITSTSPENSEANFGRVGDQRGLHLQATALPDGASIHSGSSTLVLNRDALLKNCQENLRAQIASRLVFLEGLTPEFLLKTYVTSEFPPSWVELFGEMPEGYVLPHFVELKIENARGEATLRPLTFFVELSKEETFAIMNDEISKANTARAERLKKAAEAPQPEED